MLHLCKKYGGHGATAPRAFELFLQRSSEHGTIPIGCVEQLLARDERTRKKLTSRSAGVRVDSSFCESDGRITW
jgi:hypothetical protein